MIDFSVEWLTIREAADAAARSRRLTLAVASMLRHDAVLRAARKIRVAANGSDDIDREEFAELLSRVDHGVGRSKDVDLLIRTGGEQRLSDFLLWECAYAELYFTRRMWPDFSATDLGEAVEEFHARERRFGAVPEAAAG